MAADGMLPLQTDPPEDHGGRRKNDPQDMLEVKYNNDRPREDSDPAQDDPARREHDHEATTGTLLLRADRRRDASEQRVSSDQSSLIERFGTQEVDSSAQEDPSRREHDLEVPQRYTTHPKNVEALHAGTRGQGDPGHRDQARRGPDLQETPHYTTMPKNKESGLTGGPPDLKEGDITNYIQTWHLAAFGMGPFAWATDDEDPFQEGWEPMWYVTILDDGHELQRSGIDTVVIANAIDREIENRQDERYARTARMWAASLRKRWLRHPHHGRPHRWGPHPPEYTEEFAKQVEDMMRTRWLRELCPEAVMNRACEASRVHAGFPDPSCSTEALEREWHEARNRRLSRSRTPQRRHARAAGPRPPAEQEWGPNRRRMTEEDLSCWDSEVRMHLHQRGTTSSTMEEHLDMDNDPVPNGRPRRLLGRRERPDPAEAEDYDQTALVVRKWYLKKKKKSGYMRRLVDNPAAWRTGPGVTVTSSTRHLLHDRHHSRSAATPPSGGDHSGRATAASSSNRGERCEPGTPFPSAAETEPQDMEDAHFIWRAVLQLESDEECEEAEPQRMPGFINDPVWSNVWETLANQSEPAFRLMRRALPGFLELVGQDLQSIVDQVAYQRGIPDEPEGEENDQASASSARPGGEADATDEVEVPVEEEAPDTSSLMQRECRKAEERDHGQNRALGGDQERPGGDVRELNPDEPPETATVPKNTKQEGHHHEARVQECNRRLCELRDDLEDQWYQGMSVNEAINHLQATCRSGLQAGDLRECNHILQQFLLVIPQEHQMPAPVDTLAPTLPLSSSQQLWADTTAEMVQTLVLLKKEEDETEEMAFMQRTITGTFSTGTPHLAKALNQDLNAASEAEAANLAGALLKAIQQQAADVPEWDSVHAVLVAYAGKPPKAPPCSAAVYGRAEWLRRWMARLLRRGGDAPQPEQASSSNQLPITMVEESPEEQHERLERQQNEEDVQLFKWHQEEQAREEQKRAREAQLQDRAALQANLGWSSAPPGKKIRVTVEMRSTTSSRYSEWEVGEGDEIKLKLGISMVEHGGNYINEGRKVDREIGTRELLRREQKIVDQMQKADDMPEAPQVQPERGRAWSTNDPDLQPHYQAWREGRLDFKNLVANVGEEAAMFLVEAAEVAQLELDTVPDVNVSAREEWLQGGDVEAILARPACIADYHRWAEGDLLEGDLVDKWGGPVKRAFHAWFLNGGPPQNQEAGDRATQLHESNLEANEGESRTDAPPHEAMAGSGEAPDTMDDMETIPWVRPAWATYFPDSDHPPHHSEEDDSPARRRRDGIPRRSSSSSGS
ncbi:unnamed protein product [Symbiodinium sp. CCMP2592]|nr:unnamed protein product [Symbiodinium sp. CCMP2592]